MSVIITLTQENKGTINIDALQEICFQFRVPLEQDMLEMLIRWCSVGDDPNLVQYPLFMQYMNWKGIVPSDRLNSTTIGLIPSIQLANKLASVTLMEQSPSKAATTAVDQTDGTAVMTADQAVTSSAANDVKQTTAPTLLVYTPAGSYRTSSQTIGATVGSISNMNYPTCGVPTIRSDKAAPRIKRVSDNTVS